MNSAARTLEPQWGKPPGGPRRPLEPILRVPPGPPLTYVCLSERVLGVWTHYIEESKRTVPCLGTDGRCHVDHQTTSMRWQGWLAVKREGNPVASFLALTEGATRDCPFFFDDRVNLRGLILRIGRTGNSNRCRMTVDSRGERATGAIPAAPDAKLFLERLWGSIFREAAARSALAAGNDLRGNGEKGGVP